MPKPKKSESAFPVQFAPQRRDVAVDQIDPNPWNGHRTADDDLVASVREHGVLSNLVVRWMGDSTKPSPIGDRYQLVAGARRLDAAKRAGLTDVPCIVLDLGDHAAREVTIIENLQREDLHPVYEARAIAELLADHDTAEVAAKIGKSPAFVTRRAKLAQIAPEALDVLGDDLRRIPIRALELLATLPVPEQMELVNNDGVYLTTEVVDDHIQSTREVIQGAPFDCADETLVPEVGVCAQCPKRTGAEPLLFDDLAAIAKADRCLDPACYQRKRDVSLARLEGKAREKHGDALMLVASSIPYGEAGTELRKRGVKELAQEWSDTGLKRCKKSEKGATPAFVVSGKGEGETIWVRNVSKVETPHDSADRTAATADPMEAKREKLDQRRYAWMAAELTKLVTDVGTEGCPAMPAKRYCNDADMCRIAAAFGGWAHEGDGIDYWTAESSSEEDWQCIWSAAAHSLTRAVAVFRVGDINANFVSRCKVVADLVGKSWNELWGEACEAIPEPKAWSK